MRIVIAGGGIAGLVTALLLHDAGIECAVYERGSQIRGLGVGINVLPQAVAPLARIGLLDRLAGAAVRTAELRYTHRLGQEILRRPCGLAAGSEVPQLSIHRGRLLNVLYDAVRERLGADAVRTGHRLTAFTQDDAGVRAEFADPEGRTAGTAEGDVLVGADGIHSTVRAELAPGEGPPRWNGVLMWRGAAEWPAFLGGSTMIVAGGNAAKLVLYPIAAGRTPETRLTNWALCVQLAKPGTPPPVRADWTRPGDPAEALAHLRRFASPHVDVAGLVGATERFYEYPMCDRDPLPGWTRGRVTLLGDAAHPMYPMGSNGAGQAVLDAVSLCAALRDAAGPRDALRAYEEARRPVTADLVLRNRVGGPERVIDEVERRAPDGFTDLADVIEPAELDAIIAGYQAVSGGQAPPRAQA
ncbi:MAG TPA: flavin-dependent oxidoreductase [Streptosporangiaceae bacterium]|jgi:2-polyprenyl-6-methoxyphenol hydroxylase-like FAD-dependent oxidoreductase